MRTIRVTEHISLDGVVQLGGPGDEAGFAHGGGHQHLPERRLAADWKGLSKVVRMSICRIVMLAAGVLASVSASATAPSRDLTPEEASQLIMQERRSEGMKMMDRYGIDLDSGWNRRFYFLVGILDVPGAEGVDNYAVDRKTGDVWWASGCVEATTPAFERIKRRLRKSIGLSASAYGKIKVDGPMCEMWWPRNPRY